MLRRLAAAVWSKLLTPVARLKSLHSKRGHPLIQKGPVRSEGDGKGPVPHQAVLAGTGHSQIQNRPPHAKGT
jgi:hypothetical protein